MGSSGDSKFKNMERSNCGTVGRDTSEVELRERTKAVRPLTCFFFSCGEYLSRLSWGISSADEGQTASEPCAHSRLFCFRAVFGCETAKISAACKRRVKLLSTRGGMEWSYMKSGFISDVAF
jgi:hypothetical protein